MSERVCPSDVSDAQWNIIAPLFPPARSGGRPRKVEMRRIVDGAYAGQLVEWVRKVYHRTLEIVKRPDDLTGFAVLSKRWIVGRAFSWLYR